ncbi:glycoside hydrolase family 65 protein [Aquincola sp. S2]|uniref:Glycoside hydrolase family 65 protein n=1 Tax=Pseudaquabacterium terrae TaxID=2732868 RepID=A0ABX2EUK8_9BURK|nr:glycoside hydrolase family 65 protein [Aquabacterium terrae]NRF72146.1 glycoside hydrolase family 65 protein [Aquabacterium terrae]
MNLDTWALRRQRFDAAAQPLDATLFAIGNGFIGLRGVGDEGPAGGAHDGCYLNGFYETAPIHHPETAFGLARENQFMLSVPSGKRLQIWLDDECFDPLQGTLLHYEQALDFRRGVLERQIEWQSPGGRRVRIASQRLVCQQRRTLWAARTEVTALNFDGRIALVINLDARVGNLAAGDDPRVGSHVAEAPLLLQSVEQDAEALHLMQRTRRSGLALLSSLAWSLDAATVDGGHAVDSCGASDCLSRRFELPLVAGQMLRLDRFGTYHTSLDHPEDQLAATAMATLAAARRDGFAMLREEQAAYLERYWSDADLVLEGDDRLQQALRFNAWHLLQSAGRDGRTNIAAKGLTGEGYEGHTFWDTEVYVLPFFVATQPAIARSLLVYRHRLLPAARERARELAHARGARFPWRTIAGGECSAYFLAGTAQVHLNADIAHAVQLYWEASGDDHFMLQQGAELVLETARIWPDLGHHDALRGGAFCIHGVTGPDEYTALVDNNWYTNRMAQRHLRFALQVLDWLAAHHRARLAELTQQLALGADEPPAWARAAEAMFLPVDARLGVHPQDDSFLHKPRWNLPDTRHPLLLHYHPLVIYRHQVCKQADVMLALLLAGDDIDLNGKARDYDHYAAVTTHDSSLSYCVFGVIAAEIGRLDQALDYFERTTLLDLGDTHHNTAHGVHTAAMAGSWMGLVQGFGGLRWPAGRASFRPRLPPQWQRYAFRLWLRDAQLEVSVTSAQATYRLLHGEAAEFFHDGQPQRVHRAEPLLHLPLHAA